MAESLIGVGLAFPMRLDPSGSIALVTRETKIEQSIRLILATAHGERPMRPDFGSGVHNYVVIDVEYVVRGTNDPRNLVFPFYVIPSEARS